MPVRRKIKKRGSANAAYMIQHIVVCQADFAICSTFACLQRTIQPQLIDYHVKKQIIDRLACAAIGVVGDGSALFEFVVLEAVEVEISNLVSLPNGFTGWFL